MNKCICVKRVIQFGERYLITSCPGVVRGSLLGRQELSRWSVVQEAGKWREAIAAPVLQR